MAFNVPQAGMKSICSKLSVQFSDEYEPGKVITWWSVSSTTADEKVARRCLKILLYEALSY